MGDFVNAPADIERPKTMKLYIFKKTIARLEIEEKKLADLVYSGIMNSKDK